MLKGGISCSTMRDYHLPRLVQEGCLCMKTETKTNGSPLMHLLILIQGFFMYMTQQPKVFQLFATVKQSNFCMPYMWGF